MTVSKERSVEMKTIREIAIALNFRANEYEVGRLQELRSEFTGKQQMRRTIFDVPSKGVNEKEDWAYHYGGRSEVQYNIGIEHDLDRFRFGLAFSLEPSQFMKDVVSQLAPKIERFNELVIAEPELFFGWRMWVWNKGRRITPDTAVRRIAPEEVLQDHFIFFGRSVPVSRIDLDIVLRTFDQLLPVYRFIEGHPQTLERLFGGASTLAFVERFELPEDDMRTRSAQEETNVDLKSKPLTRELRKLLEAEDKTIAFGTEIPSGSGGKIDLVVKTTQGLFDLYEVKPALLARHAIRQALPQLLEYAYRSDNENIRSLYIASQAELDECSDQFLGKLRDKGIPIWYRQVNLPE